MVSYSDVQLNNESLKRAGSGLTAVFVGATNGIGLGALRSLTRNTERPTIYIVGRSQTRLDALIPELKEINEGAEFVPILAQDLALVKDAQKAAEKIKSKATKVDLLIMTMGYIDLAYHESSEGLDRLNAIRYYSRIRFLVTLAPLLRAAPSPRVVSVGGAGKEGQIWSDDFELKDHYSMSNAIGASTSMTTLFFEHFTRQADNEKLVLLHTFPGMVGDTASTLGESAPWWLATLLRWLVTPMMRLVGYTMEEAGDRTIFAATSGRFRRLAPEQDGKGTSLERGSDGRIGSGVYLVQPDSSVVTENKILAQMKREGMGEKVVKHTMEVFKRLESENL